MLSNYDMNDDTPRGVFVKSAEEFTQYAQLLKNVLLSLDNPIEQPEVLLSLNDAPILWRGCKSFVCGVAKTRKTTMLTLLSAVLTGRNETKRGFVAKSGLRVLYIDTEQSNYDTFKLLQRVKMLSNPDNSMFDSNNNFDAINVNSASPDDIKNIMEVALRVKHYDVVILDNWTDCVESIMREEDCTMFARQLRQLADTYNIAILSVVHANQTDIGDTPNMRGWAKEEERKSDLSMFLIDKGEYSEVRFGRCRGMKPDAFKIGYKDNSPCFFDDEEVTQFENPDKYRSVVAQIPDEGLTSKELSKVCETALKCSNRSAYTYISNMKNLGLIVLDNRRYYRVK